MVFRKSNDKTKLKIFICYKGIIKIHKNDEFCYSILLYLLHKVYNDEAGAVAVGQQAKGHVESESGDGRRRLQVDPRGQTAEQCKVKLCKKNWTKRRSIYIHTRYLSVSSTNMRFWTNKKCPKAVKKVQLKPLSVRRISEENLADIRINVFVPRFNDIFYYPSKRDI